MNKSKLTLLLAPLVILAGCNSGSSSNNIDKKSVTKPVADYTFSNKELMSLMSEREEILNSIRINYQGNSYDKILFAENLSEEQLVIKLADQNNNKIDFMLSSDDEVKCVIYSSNTQVDVFDCDSSTQSTSGESTLIQSTTQLASQPIQVEFISDAPEYIASVGSTILTATQNNNQVDIVTSFSFNDFYRDVFNITDETEKIHSTLGVTTFLQLSEIVKENVGTNMIMKFNNDIGGSADDDINMYTGLMIHNHQMSTLVTPTGSVFSGGTDLFAAGNPRILQRSNNTDAIETNEQIGVHSWSDGQNSAKDIPYTDTSHRKQATFFNTVMGEKGIDFYVFTLDAAPFDGAHWITKSDSDKYGFITEIQ